MGKTFEGKGKSVTDDRKRRSDAGFLSVELMVAVGFSLVFLVFLVNFIFIQYGKGVIRAAADEGARAGSRVDATEVVCQQRAESIMDSLGAMASKPKITCTVNTGTNT